MKKGIVILLVLVSTGTMVFAGTKDRPNSSPRNESYRDDRDNHGNRMEDFIEDSTIVTVSGTLELVNGEMPKLKSGKTTYSIRAPFQQLIDLEVKDGMKVTLEGVERTTPMVWDQSEKMFIVTKITIDGKSTEIDFDDRFNMMGDRDHMMGGRNFSDNERTTGKGFRN